MSATATIAAAIRPTSATVPPRNATDAARKLTVTPA